GVDFSMHIIERAMTNHPSLHFVEGDAHNLDVLEPYADEPFDVIIMSDLLNDVWDVQTVLEQVVRFADSHTRIIINTYSSFWQSPIAMAEKLGLATPVLHQSWLMVEDMAGLLELAGCQTLRSWQEILCPLPIPLLAPLANRFLVKLPFFRLFALTNFIVARPNPNPKTRAVSFTQSPSVSVIVPTRNEAGNIAKIFERMPEMGSATELIFIEGHSTDGTYKAIESAM